MNWMKYKAVSIQQYPNRKGQEEYNRKSVRLHMARIKSGVKASKTIKGKSERWGGETIEEGTAGWPEACFQVEY